MARPTTPTKLVVRPARSAEWPHLVELFGSRGACGGCWCMTPRLTRREYEKRKGTSNRRALKRLVDGDDVPGVLGYLDGRVAGWCSLGPRSKFSILSRSRILYPVDEAPVWSIVCLFVAGQCRGRGVSVDLIRGAVDYAASQGARMVEAYPIEPKTTPMPPVFAYWGLAAAFRAAGFVEVSARSETRSIYRRGIAPTRRVGGTARRK